MGFKTAILVAVGWKGIENRGGENHQKAVATVQVGHHGIGGLERMNRFHFIISWSVRRAVKIYPGSCHDGRVDWVLEFLKISDHFGGQQGPLSWIAEVSGDETRACVPFCSLRAGPGG